MCATVMLRAQWKLYRLVHNIEKLAPSPMGGVRGGASPVKPREFRRDGLSVGVSALLGKTWA